MLTDSLRITLEYEQTRLYRYIGIKGRVEYSAEDFQEAYFVWTTSSTGNREKEWDAYCDMRDHVPRGTNWRIRRKLMQSRFN